MSKYGEGFSSRMLATAHRCSRTLVTIDHHRSPRQADGLQTGSTATRVAADAERPPDRSWVRSHAEDSQGILGGLPVGDCDRRGGRREAVAPCRGAGVQPSRVLPWRWRRGRRTGAPARSVCGAVAWGPAHWRAPRATRAPGRDRRRRCCRSPAQNARGRAPSPRHRRRGAAREEPATVAEEQDCRLRTGSISASSTAP